MLFQGESPHPSHRAFGDAVGCDYLHFEEAVSVGDITDDSGSTLERIQTGIELRGYDTVIAEGTAPLQTALVSSFCHNNTTVFLAADRTFQTLPERKSEALWKAINPIASSLVDGIVSVSNTVLSWVEPYISTKTCVVRPPIMDDKYELLRGVDIDTSGRNILAAGRPDPSKNFHLLSRIASEVEDTSVVILGDGHTDKEYANHPDVRTPGFVDLEEFVDYFREASLFLQPSSGDAFPVAAMEAMLSGTPTMVAENVGTTEIIDDVMVTSLEKVIENVERFLGMDTRERRAIATEQRSVVTEFTESIQQEKFREAIERFEQ